jgi:hypothetical protein
MNKNESPRFYFALFRLLLSFRGGDPRRREQNGVEASIASILIFLVSYFFLAQVIPETYGPFLTTLIFIALAFAVWLLWLVALYLNSLVIRALRSAGLARFVPDRRMQSVLIGITVTAMAVQLLQNGGWPGEIAAIWLIAVVMNLTAAAILAFRHGEHSRE